MKKVGLTYKEAIQALLRGECVQQAGKTYKLTECGGCDSWNNTGWSQGGDGVSPRIGKYIVPDPSVINWGPPELVETVMLLRDDESVGAELYDVLLKIAAEIDKLKKEAA